MATTIKLKNSVTTTAAPTTLVQGEAAVNVTDKKVWVGNAASSPVQILGAGATVSGTDATFTGVTTVQAGTVSAPAITTTGDTNTGIFFPAADTIAFTEGGVESMRITSAGNVGIGISTPATNLHINETDVSGTDVDIVRFSTTSGGVINFVCSDLSSSTPTWTLQTGTSEPFAFKQGTTERMRIDSAGNVGIGTSSPLTNLDVRASGGSTLTLSTSTTIVTSGQNLGSIVFQAPNEASGSQSILPAASISAVATVANFNTANNDTALVFSTNATGASPTERMRLDSSGNLGLGVTPSAWTSFRGLEIPGGAVAGIAQNQLVVTQNAYYDSNFKYKTTGAATVYQQAGAQHAWLTAASGTAGNAITFTQAMTLDASGRLGIGTTSPATQLQVSSATGTATPTPTEIRIATTSAASDWSTSLPWGRLSFYSSDTSGAGPKIHASIDTVSASTQGNTSSLVFSITNGTTGTLTEHMRIDNAGNVGIGTSSPTQKLDVRGAIVMTDGGTQTTYISNAGEIELARTAGDAYIDFKTSTAEDYDCRISQISDGLRFLTGGSGASSERMRINSSGLVLIGKTTDNINNVGIQLSPVGAVAFTRSTASGFVGYWNIQGGSGGIQEFYFADVAKGSISVAAGGTTYATTSDYRLKENIAPMTGALNVVQQLKPVTYNWKADGSSGQGFIAHELQEVVPDCVTGEKDAVNEDGSIKAQGIDTSFLVATLTAAIQEQQTLIENLTTRLNALEGK